MTGIPLTRILATPRRAVTPDPLYRADDTLPASSSGDRRKRMGLDAAALRDIERQRLRALVQAAMDTAAALHADGTLDPLDGGQPGLGERDAGPGLIALELGRLDPGDRPSVAEGGS